MTAISAVPPVLAELAAECGVATGYTDAHGVHREVSERTLRAVLAAMGVGAPSGTGGVDNDDHDDDDDDKPAADQNARDQEALDLAPRDLDTLDLAALDEIRLRPWRQVLPPTVVARQGTTTTVPVHLPLGATVAVTAHLEEGGRRVTLLPLSGPRMRKSVDGLDMEQVTVSVPGDLPSGWHRLVVVVDPVAVTPTSPRPDAYAAPGHASPGAPSDAPIDPTVDRPPLDRPPLDRPTFDRATFDRATIVEATLLVAPTSIPLPAGLDERRAVGLAAQIYQVRSAGSWGVGDLEDLGRLAAWGAHDLGADFVLVNPMHAGEPFPPLSHSPYLPTTRRFASPLYLRPELVPEYAELIPADRSRVDGLARTAAGVPSPDAGSDSGSGSGTPVPNSADSIDRDASWTAKLEALRILFEVPLTPDRAASFEKFLRDQEPGLRSFATWCALAGEHGTDWTGWPTELRDPDSASVAHFAAEHSEEVRFHQWLQWLTAEQRARAQQTALDAGMRVGIIHDLAVGVHPTGADAWELSRSLARGVSVGAPPDIYNQRGQDWSQPPLRPDSLAEDGYRAFRDIVRAALRDAGGVRIDHILGLFRLWWIPDGASPTEGTYVHYDHEAMLAVLALEASRSGAVVIGEDLGTVAPGVRESLAERGMLGTSVMWFEQDDDGRPRDPRDYRELCMASVTTHDLAPTAGYAELVHVDLRDQLGQLTRDVELERSDAAAGVRGFVSAVEDRGLLKSESSENLVVALHEYVATSPSVLFAVSVADLVGDRRPVNMPGTNTEYPNWSVPICDAAGRVVGLEQLKAVSAPGRVFEAIFRGQAEPTG